MVTKNKGFRGFYYFRLGYTTYLTVIVAVVNLLSSTYFLAIKKVPWILGIFPTFTEYVVFCIFVGTPIIIVAGWLHLKKIGTYGAESDIINESHPYNFKFPPGYQKEVLGPAWSYILKINIKRANGEKLTEDELLRIKQLEERLKNLITGGFEGSPPKGTGIN